MCESAEGTLKLLKLYCYKTERELLVLFNMKYIDTDLIEMLTRSGRPGQAD